MDDVVKTVGTVTGAILLVMFLFPWIVSSLFIDYIGNFTDSIYVFISLYFIFGLLSAVVVILPFEGFWLKLIFLLGAVMLIWNGVDYVKEFNTGNFNYEEAFEAFENWSPPN